MESSGGFERVRAMIKAPPFPIHSSALSRGQHREILAPDEYKVLCRLRQLREQGAKLVIVEFSEKMRVRRVGEVEG